MHSSLRPIAKLCHTANCCPVVAVDERRGKRSNRRIVIHDDFGGTVAMSAAQLRALAKKAREGAFAHL